MRPTFLGFETQKRTLQLAQKNLDITGNNISNINTPGYTRQRVDMYSLYVSGNRSLRWGTKTTNLSMQGQGVNAYGVSQIRDVFIDRRYRENVSVEAETDTKVQILTEIEDVVDDFETDGLQYYTTQFFKALQDYSGEKPDSTEVATIVVNAATNLCKLLNVYDTELREIEQSYVSELSDSVAHINDVVEDMAALNDRIAKEKIHLGEGYDPNELCDEMNLYIDELATYGNIEFDRNDDGTYNVMLGDVTILNGAEGKTNRLIMKDYDKYGLAVVQYESGQTTSFSSGALKGYIDMLNGNGVYASGGQNNVHGIAYYKSAINEFARTLANTFNKANGAEESASRMMFESSIEDALITAGNIHVADSWREDPTMIGMVRTLDPVSGFYKYGFDENKDDIKDEETSELVNLQNSNIKYLISQFDNKAIKFGNCHDFEGSIYEYISFVSNRLGQDIDYEISRQETAEVTVDGLLDARDDVSAVQMDEEGINMLNYQKWYNASSRMVTALDDLLDKLINGTGRVGL